MTPENAGTICRVHIELSLVQTWSSELRLSRDLTPYPRRRR